MQQKQRQKDLYMSKSAAKLNFSAKREQPRKFGEFHGEDGLEMQAPTTSIW